MNLLLNDLSFHGQFTDLRDFRDSIGCLMKMRYLALKQFGRETYCHKRLAGAKITQKMYLQETLAQMSKDERQALMGWFSKHGPFWAESAERHNKEEIWSYENEVVTDTALAEAAFQNENEVNCQLISIKPSDWEKSPLMVHREGLSKRIEVQNHSTWQTLEEALQNTAKPVKTWKELEQFCRRRFTSLTFAQDAFVTLEGIPFGSTERFIKLFDALEKLKAATNERGERTEEGHRIYEQYFMGNKPPFSNSSDSEMNNEIFRTKLTFPHPESSGNSIECPWHGKIYHECLRFHFSWPINAVTPLYIVYIGPKLTKK